MNNRLPVLMFHHLDDAAGPIIFPPALFRRLAAFLKDEGYRSITFGSAVEMIRSRREIPDKTLVITFDDGFRSVFDSAFPILAENHFTATVFLATGPAGQSKPGLSRLPSIDEREMMNWKEIGELSSAGFEIGAHTMSHPDLTRLGGREVYEEASRSRDIIEQKIGREVNYFAYPFGAFNPRIKRIVAEIFRGACSVKLGLAGRESDPYALERVDAFYLRDPRLFRMLPSPIFPLYLGALRVARSVRRRLKETG